MTPRQIHLHKGRCRRRTVVPAELQQQVRAAGGTLGGRDLFVKRVAAIGGDKVALTPEGGIVVNGEPRAAPPLQCAGPRGGGGGIKAESGGEPRAVTFARVVPRFGNAVLLEVLRAKQRVFRIELGEGNLFPSAMCDACQKGL